MAVATARIQARMPSVASTAAMRRASILIALTSFDGCRVSPGLCAVLSGWESGLPHPGVEQRRRAALGLHAASGHRVHDGRGERPRGRDERDPVRLVQCRFDQFDPACLDDHRSSPPFGKPIVPARPDVRRRQGQYERPRRAGVTRIARVVTGITPLGKAGKGRGWKMTVGDGGGYTKGDGRGWRTMEGDELPFIPRFTRPPSPSIPLLFSPPQQALLLAPRARWSSA